MKNKTLTWRRLDNSAKIFPLAGGKKYSTVFRLSVVLKENIDVSILRQAVEDALDKYSEFKVKMKKGFFWYYLEQNTKKIKIEEEKDYPCKYIENYSNSDYLFKVTYFKTKINIDIFHVLTDGNSGSVFFKEIVYRYLELKYPYSLGNDRNLAKKEYSDAEDSYIQNYDKRSKNKLVDKKAYTLKGRKIALGGIAVNHVIINSEDLKRECIRYNISTTMYLTSVLIWSIYNTNYIKHRGNKPIKICVPVNLKKYFPSNTLSNFFSYISINSEKENMESFKKITEFVKNEFERLLTKDEIIKTMSSNVKIGKNLIMRIIPLFIKKILIKLSYIEIRRYTTITYSNIGRMGIIGKYQEYMEYFLMLIAPESVEKIKCSSVAFGDKLVFTFTSILNNLDIERYFVQFLKQNNICLEIESNGVGNDIS